MTKATDLEWVGDTEGRKDYRVTLKVQNNYLLRLMAERGIETASALSRDTGLSQSQIGDILNLKAPAYTQRGKPSSATARLCEFFSCEPEDLFPPQHLHESLPQNTVLLEADREELLPSYLLEGTADPLDALEALGEAKDIHEAMKQRLTYREMSILEHRFGLQGKEPLTLEATGVLFSVGKDRIRQLEERALRKLRKHYNPPRPLIPMWRSSDDESN
jgi:DNA-binding Xre family transcriptional regulator